LTTTKKYGIIITESKRKEAVKMIEISGIIRRMGEKGMVSIPLSIRKELGLKPDDYLEFNLLPDGKIIINKMEVIKEIL
jgi:AbrB family looped-hinge helix DNA binding protein